MRKVFLCLFAILFYTFTFAIPSVSELDGVIDDPGVRDAIKSKTDTGKIKYLGGTKLINLGPSQGKLKGTIWGQFIKLKIKNSYGTWVESEFELYVVETSSGRVIFAGIQDKQ